MTARTTRNGHHHGALTAIAAVRPTNEATPARLQARARDRKLNWRWRSSAREPASAPSSVSVAPIRYSEITRTAAAITAGIETHHSGPPRTSQAAAKSTPASAFHAGLRSRGLMEVLMSKPPHPG